MPTILDAVAELIRNVCRVHWICSNTTPAQWPLFIVAQAWPTTLLFIAVLNCRSVFGHFICSRAVNNFSLCTRPSRCHTLYTMHTVTFCTLPMSNYSCSSSIIIYTILNQTMSTPCSRKVAHTQKQGGAFLHLCTCSDRRIQQQKIQLHSSHIRNDAS